MTDDEIMTSEAVAKYLQVSPSLVRSWRARRVAGDPEAGPPFYRLGEACRYRRAEVDEWFTAQRDRPTAATG